MLLSKEESKRIIDKVLSLAPQGADVGVTVGGGDVAQTRFANNSVNTSGRHSTMAINISITKDKRAGRASVGESSDEALTAAIHEAEAIAGFSPPDPEYMAPLGLQKYPDVKSFDPAVAGSGHKELAALVKASVAAAEAKQLGAAGYMERVARSQAFGNSAGNFGYNQDTDSEFTVTARTSDGTGSGWAEALGWNPRQFDAAAVSRVAVDKAVLSQKPRPIEPGKYTVILEPACVSDMVPQIMQSFNARNAEEGRSLLSKRGGGTLLGEKVFSEKITFRTDPFDPRRLANPWAGGVPVEPGGAGQFFFAGGGGGGGGLASFLPAEPVTWIEKGVVKNLSYTRYWADKKGVKPVVQAGPIIIEGEDHTLDDLIKSTDKGLLITHFFYIRSVNPQTVQLTGLTRDGIFMIENGKIAYPVTNFRWNESPANVLKNVEMLSKPVRTANHIMPAMKVRDFTMSSVSDAV